LIVINLNSEEMKVKKDRIINIGNIKFGFYLIRLDSIKKSSDDGATTVLLLLAASHYLLVSRPATQRSPLLA
jgi:hypothetical protein